MDDTSFAAALMVMLNDTDVESPSPFVAVTLNEAIPAEVGVPEMTPLLSKVSPAGNVPLDTAQPVGLFVAASISVYGDPTVPPVSAPEAVVITGAALNVCVTVRSLTALYGMVNSKANVSPATIA